LVLATQNPIEQEGTYPLPEAQVDRFMLKVKLEYPNKSEEQKIMRQNLLKEFPVPNQVIKTSKILEARELIKEIYIDEKIEQYIVDLIFATRNPFPEHKNLISFGASPRASINLAKAAKAIAFINRRGYVIPEDVRSVALDVLRHRLGLTYEAEAEEINSDQIIKEIINKVQVP
jgi:MoxR-like ATPase